MGESGDIKIARVRIAIEKAVEASFDGDPFVWLTEKKLDEMAGKHPSDYLRRIEYIARVINKPDYARFDPKTKTLALIREDISTDESFVKTVVELSRDGGRWVVGDCYRLDDAKAKLMNAEIRFARVG
jgi:hypothetical protein